MNKEQFLLELSQYLTFVSAEERAQVIEEYNEKFEAAGAADEASLILSLGTPMMIAIALKRRKESGEPLTEHPAPKKPDPAPEPEAAPPAPAQEAEAEAAPETEKAPEPDIEAAVAAAAQADISAEEDEAPEAECAPAKKKVGAGAVISCVLLSLLSAVFAVIIMALGAYFFIIFGNLLVVAFQSLNLLNQALLLFAGALVSGGVGLVIVWLGLWTGIRLIAKQIARLRA